MKRNYPSSKRKIKCRFCDDEMLEKNYTVHLQRKHGECGDTADKRSAGQTSIANFVLIQANKNEEIESENIRSSSTSEEHTVKDICSLEGDPLVAKDDEKAEESTTDDKFLLILQSIKKLEKEVATIKQNKVNIPNTCSEKDNENKDEEKMSNIAYVLQSCRSICDITSFFDEFEFNESLCMMICRTCVPVGKALPEKKGFNCHPATFFYNTENGTDFPAGSNLPTAFRYLKKHLKDHLSSSTHKRCMDLIKEKETEEETYERREREVGMRIGRIAYRLYYKGRPYSDFEEEIAMNVQNGCDMGDINHSEAFAKKFLVYVSDIITYRLKRFLNERLHQTGFKPPIKIIADKATWKHRTRHFIMAVTVVPDSDQLLHAIYLGHPVIKTHDGQSVANSILSCMSDWGLTKNQFIGGSFDGQYFNLGVPKYLNHHFKTDEDNRILHYDWDPMHHVIRSQKTDNENFSSSEVQ